jgi:hypothetical protein
VHNIIPFVFIRYLRSSAKGLFISIKINIQELLLSSTLRGFFERIL